MKLNIPGYEQAIPYTGVVEALPPGGYVCKITNTKVEPWLNGKGQSLVLAIDIIEGERKGFFKAQFDSNPSAEKKWRGTHRQTIPTDVNDKALGWFKGMITHIEASNSGFKWDMDTNSLNNKIIGCIFGREEYHNMNTGKPAFATKVMSVTSADIIRKGEFKVPEDKLMELHPDVLPYNMGSGFTETSVNDDDLPF